MTRTTFVTEPSGGLCGGSGEGSARPQLAVRAAEPSRDAPAALKKSLRVSFLLPNRVSRLHTPLWHVSMSSMALIFVSFVAVSFLLAPLLLMEAGGVVSLPPRLSAGLLYLFYFSLFAVIATMLLVGISTLAAAGV
jgi:hypothetical protein